MIPSRIHSAPSTVGRVEEEEEEEENGHQIQSLSSCGDLISKVQLRENQKDSVKTRKGVRKLFQFNKFRARTGNYSLEENENFEKRKQSWVQDSNPTVLKNDCPKEPVETTKVIAGSGISNFFSSLTGFRSADENEGVEKRRRSWFKSKKSKVSIVECPGRSVEVDAKTGVPELTFFTVNTYDNAKIYTKIKTAPVEEMNPIVLNKGYSEELVKTKQDIPDILFAEESKAQTKFHSMAENAGTCFDDSLQPISSLGKLSREEEGNRLKHPTSKTIPIIERVSETESKSSVKYIYYKAKHFQHFHYIYNLTRDCHDRIAGLRKTNDRTHFMAEDIVVKIGIVGESTEDKLNSLLKRRGTKEMPSQNQQIWKHSPIICFQESTKSTLKILRRETACHKILIISDPNHKETEQVEDSIFIIKEDKEHILRTISICLEEEIHQILQDLLSNLSLEGFGKHLTGVTDEIEDIRKEMFDVNTHLTTSVSAFGGAVKESVVPSNVIKYLFGRPDVNSFGIWRNSSFKVFVKKTIDVNELEHALKKLDKNLFEKYNLEIVKGRLVALETLKQGDFVSRKEDGKYYAGTLGGFVTKADDERKIYALTCNHVFPKEKLLAYADNPEKDIGTCVFTKNDSSCDFAAIEIKGSFSNKCDVALRREDNKQITAKVYNESLERITFVHKIGAATNLTKGRIISSEYYNKVLPENTFLVKGTGKHFSEKGDSGALVFSRPRTGRQNYVNVIGMVYANNVMLYDDVDDSDSDHNVEKDKDLEGSQNKDAERKEANVEKTTTSSNSTASSVGDDDQNIENLSCCYRIHPAFDLFKEERGVGVKFKDDLPTPSSSPDDSYEEAS